MIKTKKLFVGIAVGSLVGLLIGLSISQVVGLLVGGITSVLVTFFGLKNDNSGSISSTSQTIISAFSVSCLIFILLGLYLRTHEFLSPTVNDYYKELQPLALDSSELKKIILLKKFGIVEEHPDNKTASNGDIKPVASLNPSTTTSLYSANITDEEKQKSLEIFSSYSIAELRNYLNSQGLSYKQFYTSLDFMKIDTASQKKIIVNLIAITYAPEQK